MFNHINKLHTPENIRKIDESTGRVYFDNHTWARYPSVTTYLQMLSGPGISAWRKRVGEEEANRISRESSNIGTQMHALIEGYLYNAHHFSYSVACSDEYYEALKLFLNIRPLLHNIDNIRALEIKLMSHKLEAGGMVDCIAEYNGTPAIIDFKSSKKPKEKRYLKNYFLQLAFYSLMLNDMHNVNIEQGVILMSCRSGKISEHIVDCTEYYPFVHKLIAKYKEKYPQPV